MSICSFAETEYIFSTFVFEEFRTNYAGFHLLFSPINHFLQMNALRVSPIELGFFCRFIILPQPQNRNKKNDNLSKVVSRAAEWESDLFG